VASHHIQSWLQRAVNTISDLQVPNPVNNGAVGENRTPDLMITNQLLYLLSYNSETGVD